MYMYNRARYYRARKQFVVARNSFLLLVSLMLILPFHYVTGCHIILKNQWGFAHTIVTESDIDEALHEYNMAGKLGKDELIEQAWVQKMIYERNMPANYRSN